MILNLDPLFQPFGTDNEVLFESFTFSGGEPHIKILTDLSAVKTLKISTRVKSFNDMGLLVLAVDAVKRMGVEELHLMLPYMPGARQDRLMVSGEPLSVKVYAEMINTMNFKSVHVFDPHSEVTPALLERCQVISNHKFIQRVIEDLNEEVVLVSPDAGALKKSYQLSTFLGGIEVVEGSKKRNVQTGKLEGFQVYEEDLKGKTCLIVDDICDGGGTFLGMAKALKAKHAGTLYLAVSHGIFSKNLKALKQTFKAIYTTNSFKDINEKGMKQIPIKEVM